MGDIAPIWWPWASAAQCVGSALIYPLISRADSKTSVRIEGCTGYYWASRCYTAVVHHAMPTRATFVLQAMMDGYRPAGLALRPLLGAAGSRLGPADLAWRIWRATWRTRSRPAAYYCQLVEQCITAAHDGVHWHPAERGRMGWQRASGYNWHAPV
jgi:hypothetical protein